ncbi:MAG: hypothetical protein L6V35_06075 [Alistipes putredinis]|nr:MAG: hypothetical protein L6V35_06075 [Alistipes putredinis]
MFALLAMGACTKDDGGESSPKGITLNLKAISMDAKGGQAVVTITSKHSDFSVTTDGDQWISYVIANKKHSADHCAQRFESHAQGHRCHYRIGWLDGNHSRNAASAWMPRL